MENVVLHVVMAQWLNLKKMQVKYSTFVKYKKVIECHIDPYFGRYAAHDLNEALLYDFFHVEERGSFWKYAANHEISAESYPILCLSGSWLSCHFT